MKKYFIDPSLSQLKGQLHIHTQNSDGKLSQKEAFEKYKTKGYDFLAFTEHNRLTENELRDGVVILSGIELSRNIIEKGRRGIYHIVGIGLDPKKYTPVQHPAEPQELIDSIKCADGFAIVAHPAWSLLAANEIAALNNYDAVEVMNWISEVYHDRGESSQQTDKLMSMGRPPLLLASDDVHYYQKDFAGTATVAVCTEKSEKSIMSALRSGSMYATCGPRINALYAENGRLYLECSDAEKIFFISDTPFTNYEESQRWYYAESQPLTRAAYTPHRNDSYVRAVAVDKNGRKAWSGYISSDDIKNT